MFEIDHEAGLPIIARHMGTLGFDLGEINPLDGTPIGQRPDFYGLATRGLDEAWIDRNGACQKVFPGMTGLADHKRSKSDLDADREKPWHFRRSLGEVRLYWFPRGCGLRPEHFDLEWGWGACTYDEHSFDMVLPPVIVPDRLIAHNAEKWLIARIASRQQTGGFVPIERRSHARSESSIGNTDLVTLLDWMAEEPGPRSVAEIRRFLGVRTRPDILARDLERVRQLRRIDDSGRSAFELKQAKKEVA